MGDMASMENIWQKAMADVIFIELLQDAADPILGK